MTNIKETVNIFLPLCLVMIFAILTGCGNDINAGPQPTTITIDSNADATGHVHNIQFVLTDFSNPPDTGMSYTSSVADNHSHTLELTKQQLSDVYGGLDLNANSSVAGAPAHSHVWTLHSGNILYTQNCERCHGASKLGTPASAISAAIAANKGGVMGSLSTLTAAQIQAISTSNSL